ncbi:hypothetical protein R3P38DRAFT_1731329 [Favolaschia claudopus]|uniref:Uncharacterized protein n=1 Tax=Favolaschia claudopus TaxID=2862362 RepID=A0AAW0A9B2_9AGAR
MDNNTCTDINNRRTLYDILWSSLATIFACIWVSVHPNIPPQLEEIPLPQNIALFSASGCRYQFRRAWNRVVEIRPRLKLMITALIAPEIMVGFAARQWFSARTFSRRYEVSLTHGFFYSMGGFVNAEGYIMDEYQISAVRVLAAIKAVPQAEIEDKSKSDVLAKLLAVTQILRIVAQSLARWDQHLAITSLELTTVAYAVVTTFMWFFWMNKPLDTHTVIQILPKPSENQCSCQWEGDLQTSTNHTIHRLTGSQRFQGMLTGQYDGRHKFRNVPAYFSTPFPSFNDAHIAYVIECGVAIVFGAIHCIAWNSTFPSMAEKWMWRSSAVVVTGVPVGYLVWTECWNNHIAPPDSCPDWLHAIAMCLQTVVVYLYIIARLFLLVLPFTALRSLEPAVFIDVSWAKYIPHL